jgi:hypothetical protein
MTSAQTTAIRVFDPIKADRSGKMKQNATFCNKPPPLAPRGPHNRAKYLISQGLGKPQGVTEPETGNRQTPARFPLATTIHRGNLRISFRAKLIWNPLTTLMNGSPRVPALRNSIWEYTR